MAEEAWPEDGGVPYALLEAIYDAALDDDAFARLPTQLAAAIGVRSAALLAFDREGSPVDQACGYWPESFWAQYQRDGLHVHDLWTVRTAAQRVFGRFVDTSEFVSDDEFRRSIIYNELIRAHGDDSFYCAGLLVPLDGGGLATLGVHNPQSCRLGVSILERGEAIAPHIRRLFALRRRVEAAERRAEAAGGALDGLSTAMLVTDGHGRIVLANEAAELHLRSRAGMQMRGGRLAASDVGTAPRFTQALGEAAKGSDASDLALPRRDARSLLVSVCPLPGCRGLALVLAEDPDDDRPDLARSLAALFGLTRAESTLATMLLAGASPDEVAERRDISLSTVRSQAKSLLRKTDTRRLSEALALLGHAPRRRRDD